MYSNCFGESQKSTAYGLEHSPTFCHASSDFAALAMSTDPFSSVSTVKRDNHEQLLDIGLVNDGLSSTLPAVMITPPSPAHDNGNSFHEPETSPFGSDLSNDSYDAFEDSDMKDLFLSTPDLYSPEDSGVSRGGSPSHSSDLSSELLSLTKPDGTLQVPLKQSACVATQANIPSKYEWPLHILELNRKDFTRLTHSKQLSDDQISDLRKARRRYKNRRYAKGARCRKKERRALGLEPQTATKAEVVAVRQESNKHKDACQELLAIVQEIAPERLAQLYMRHPHLSSL